MRETFAHEDEKETEKTEQCRAWAIGILALLLIAATIVILILVNNFGSEVGGCACIFRLRVWSHEFSSFLANYTRAAVVADHGFCSEIGRNVLIRGGNAVDAAVAGMFCIGVLAPHSAGLGGGHFMTIYFRNAGKCVVFDAREVAPLASTRFMFENVSSTNGWKSIAVPGELHGLRKAFEKFGSGRISWKDLLHPSIELAEKGFPVSKGIVEAFERFGHLIINETTLQLFVNSETGEFFKEGDIIKSPALAETLRLLANSQDPIDLFYNGILAETIVEEFGKNDGILTKEDLRAYKSFQRSDVIETKIGNDFSICGPPPPSSSAIIQAILNVMSGYNFDLSTVDGNVLACHRMIEAMKFSYAERSKLGDIDFVPEALKIAQEVASHSRAEWVRQRITGQSRDNSFYGGEFEIQEDHGTGHLNAIDSEGNAVSVTSTINMKFGSKRRSVATGIIWNNEMDDFSSPGQTNNFNFPPSPANYIEPGKRPLSSMSPTIIYDRSGNVKMCLGATGGSKIISTIAYVAMRSLWFNETLKEAIDAPKIHNQLRPNDTFYERGFPKLYLDKLKKRGHKLTENSRVVGSATAIMREAKHVIYASGDYRKGPSCYPAGF